MFVALTSDYPPSTLSPGRHARLTGLKRSGTKWGSGLGSGRLCQSLEK